MNLLSELNTLLTGLGIPVETGIFKNKAPDEYAVITPMADTFEVYADDVPQCEIQEARVSLYSKQNYMARKNQIVRALRLAGFTITERLYLGYEDDTGYHHYAMDVAQVYNIEEE